MLSIATSLFGDNKKVAIAVATVDTIAGAVAAFKDTPGPWPVKAAAMAAALAGGFAQVANIKSTNVGGGGSAGGGIGGGAFTPPALPPEGERGGNLGNPERQNAVQIIFNGDVNGWDSYIQSKVIAGLREAVDQRDVVIFGSDSRQARELRGP